MPKQSGRARSQTAHAEVLAAMRHFKPHLSSFDEYVSKFYQALDTPTALACDMLYRAGEHKQLVEKEVDPSNYLDYASFRLDFAAISLLRKCKGLKTGINTKSASLSTFHKAESRCKETNILLSQRLRDASLRPPVLAVLLAQQDKIRRWLGTFDIDQTLDRCGWGPGVSLRVKGEDTSASRKFDVECDITQDAYDLFADVLTKAYSPSWAAVQNLNIVPGNTVVTVPKNAKTDRTIAIEPGINLWLQLGLGRSIRRKLKFASYNLNSDWKNSYGAFKGSLDNSLATVDFSSASDTISRFAVEFLLPRDWFLVLDAVRSKRYSIDKQPYQWSEKFSSMGNGFTFELESLIFVTLAEAVCDHLHLPLRDVSVFGDDIIIPSEAVALYTEVSEALGFTVNLKKSYFNSPFRESCGSYYFTGVDVKPIFIKDRPRVLKDVFRLANSLTDLAHTFGFHTWRDLRFRGAWHHLYEMVPEKLRFKGPKSAGDSVFGVSPSDTRLHRSKKGWEGFTFKALPTVAVSVHKDSLGLLLSKLYSTSWDFECNEVPLRARVKIVYKPTAFTSQWYDYGMWKHIP